MKLEAFVKKIVFIIGAGRSGSTILDRTLGHHSPAFSTGEIINFNRELEKGFSLCGCGINFRHCPFWNEIFEELYSRTGINVLSENWRFDISFSHGYKGIRRRIYQLDFAQSLLFKSKLRDPIIANHIARQELLYDVIFDKTRCELIVDSSKNLRRALLLANHLKDVRFYFLHLVRDGRAVLQSTQKDHYDAVMYDDQKGEKVRRRYPSAPIPPKASILTWKRDNYRILNAKHLFFKNNYFIIRYEDFCNEPKKTLKDLLSAIGLDFEEKMLVFQFGDNHIIGGNSSRLNALVIQPPSDSWKQDLSPENLRLFDRIAGRMNRRFGYE